MVILNMDMPTKCMNCQLLGRDMMYCQVYPRKDLNVMGVASGRPDWCPIKCNVDDIKTEIKEERLQCMYIDRTLANGLQVALEIINRHCKSEE